jgi:hypothetical protein
VVVAGVVVAVALPAPRGLGPVKSKRRAGFAQRATQRNSDSAPSMPEPMALEQERERDQLLGWGPVRLPALEPVAEPRPRLWLALETHGRRMPTAAH